MQNNAIPEKGFDFFFDLTEHQQNTFLEGYLVNDTKFLTRYGFPNSPGYYYFKPEFISEQHHGNSIANLVGLFHLLLARDYISTIRFKNEKQVIPATGTPVVYFIFNNWAIGDLAENDVYSFDMVQDDELQQYANVLCN